MTLESVLTLDTRPVPVASALLAAVGDEACILDTKSGAYFMLNRVGSVIWSRLQSGESLGEIHRVLLEEFSVASEMLWNDLQRFVEALRAQGLVSVEA